MNAYLFQKINGVAGKYAFLDNTGVFFAEYLGYILAALAVILFWRKYGIIFRIFLAAAAARLTLAELIRWIFPVSRPFVENNVTLLLAHTDEGSFPSGHASFFFAMSFVVYHYNKKAGILFFAASSLMSVARVFAGVHWPQDVLAGALVGVFSGWLILRLTRA